MKADQKKFHNYSLSFYQKQTNASSIYERVKVGFHNFERQGLLQPQTIENFKKFFAENKYGQKQLLKEDSQLYTQVLVDVMRNMSSDRDLMELTLPTFDAILFEEKKVLWEVIDGIKSSRGSNILSTLKSFLNIEEHREATYQSVARIISTIYGQLPRQQFFLQQKSFLLDLLQMGKDGSRRNKISDFCLITCLIHLIKHEQLAQVFIENNGCNVILKILNNNSNQVQLIYYTFLNIWLLSFVKDAVDKFISVPKYNVIRNICQILQKISREKLIRLAFAIFKNLQDNHACLELMIDSKLLKIIDTLLKGNIKQQQVIDLIKSISQILQSNIRVLSSFDKYLKQVNSEVLEWSSVHTERFWKQNAIKFEANEYQVIKKLRALLNTKNPQNQAIACYDLGEFCRFYPRGRNVLQSFQIKTLIMEKAKYSEDKSVKEQALLALQKIMIQNWQNI